MEVRLAKHAGACYGVQRALDMADEVIASGEKGYTLGPLIHNPAVVQGLAERGARVADSLDDVDDGIVIIRSHGVTPDVYAEAGRRDITLVDATCPHVARAQKAAADLAAQGCRVIVVGEAGHPEVSGLTAYAREAGAKVDVVATPDDLPEGLYDPIGVVVQTTQMRENLEAVVEALQARGLHPEVRDTVCSATRSRQAAAADLAREVDAMVIIGGRNSSNTTRLTEICAEYCPRTYHVESADELEPSWFEECTVVGVTAGASTPEDQIDAVIETLHNISL